MRHSKKSGILVVGKHSDMKEKLPRTVSIPIKSNYIVIPYINIIESVINII